MKNREKKRREKEGKRGSRVMQKMREMKKKQGRKMSRGNTLRKDRKLATERGKLMIEWKGKN